jgi:preprotein translocase subunit SecG
VILNYLVTVLYVLVCLVLLMVILLQQGKGGDIAAAFGGSSSQAAFGARAGATLLTRITTVAAVLFILGSLGLSVMWQRGGGRSVVSGAGAPAPASAPAKPAPAPAQPLK